MMSIINVANDFSLMPSGRHRSDGSYTGDHFYEILIKEIEKVPEDEKIIINFDGVLAAGSSFLEQAFAGLIREKKISKNQFFNKFEIVANEYPEIREKVKRYVSEA